MLMDQENITYTDDDRKAFEEMRSSLITYTEEDRKAFEEMQAVSPLTTPPLQKKELSCRLLMKKKLMMYTMTFNKKDN